MRLAHGLSMLAVLCMATVASAQVTRPAEPARRPVAEGTAVRQTVVDQQLAAIIHNCNHNEVELAKWAKDKAKSDDVKEFAATMIKDHQQMCDTFKRLAGQSVLSTNDTNRREMRVKNRAERVANQQPLDWVAVHQEIGDDCLASVKEELGEKEGSDFDKCYMGQQIGAHLMAHNQLKVFSEYATGAAKQEIEVAIKSVDDHLKEARKIMKELESSK